MLVANGQLTVSTAIARFMIPVLLGNIIGTALFALISHAVMNEI